MNDETPVCALCGLPLKVLKFALDTPTGIKYFCCAGCEGIYRLLYWESVRPQPDSDSRD